MIRPIRNEEDYDMALAKLSELFDARKGTPESDEADVLALLINEYEKAAHPIAAPDPIEAIKIRMEEMQLKQKDLITALGGKNRVSEVLNRKRKLNLEMVRKLKDQLNLSAELLINDYQIAE